MKKFTRILSLLTLCAVLIATFPTVALADDVLSGVCGENLTWTLDSGTLTISGSGEMENYSSNPPWVKHSDSITNIVLPDGLLSIGSYAFHHCSKFTKITLPDSVVTIGKFAFERCTALADIDMGSGVCTIEDGAFYLCSDLKDVTLPDSVVTIGKAAFNNCRQLETVHIGTGVSDIGDNAFLYCTSLTNVEIPANVEYIGQYAFGYSYQDGAGWAMEPNLKTEGFTITGVVGSAAESYAESNGFAFVELVEPPSPADIVAEYVAVVLQLVSTLRELLARSIPFG